MQKNVDMANDIQYNIRIYATNRRRGIMKINWNSRVRNPYFWLGLGGVVLAAMGAKPEMFTSWQVLITQIRIVAGNPFLLGSIIVAVIGVLCDPTTKGMGDADIKKGEKR